MPDSFSTSLKATIQRLAGNVALDIAHSVTDYPSLYSNIQFAGDSHSEEPEHPIVCGLTECRFKTIDDSTVLPDDIQKCR